MLDDGDAILLHSTSIINHKMKYLTDGLPPKKKNDLDMINVKAREKKLAKPNTPVYII